MTAAASVCIPSLFFMQMSLMLGRYEMLEAQLEAKDRPAAADANGRDGGDKKERKEKRSSHRDDKDRKHRHRRCYSG
jgi:hypothetical protein